jgi:drug/metabolite transporter (DMT)-like permease
VNARGALYAGTAAVLFGSAYVAIAIALRSYTPLTVAAWRGLLGTMILAGLIALPAMRSLRPVAPDAAGVGRLLVLGLVGGALFVIAMNAAVAATGATITAFVAGLYAVLAAVLAIPLLHERLETPLLLALLAALFGTLLLSDLQLSDESLGGIGIALVAAAAFGLFLVLSRRWGTRHRLNGPMVGMATLSVSGVAALAAAVLTQEQLWPENVRPDAVLALVWLAVGPGAAAAVLIVAGMRRLEAGRASVFLLLNPLTAALLSFLLLGERLSPLQLVGGACVLLAIAAAGGLQSRPRDQAKGGPT